ncbi:MAG: hypothetical protein QHJ73_08695 [Armatimonadota bacterium]|nr:hypothetical protein [Armatimonadota bacterium]
MRTAALFLGSGAVIALLLGARARRPVAVPLTPSHVPPLSIEPRGSPRLSAGAVGLPAQLPRWTGPGLTTANPPAMPPGNPVASAPPGFLESPWEHRIPLVKVTNAEGDRMVLELNGPACYRVVVGPWATRSVEVLPGTYTAAVWSDLAPKANTGWGVFRPFRRYSALFRIVPVNMSQPLRLGELEAPGNPYR